MPAALNSSSLSPENLCVLSNILQFPSFSFDIPPTSSTFAIILSMVRRVWTQSGKPLPVPRPFFVFRSSPIVACFHWSRIAALPSVSLLLLFFVLPHGLSLLICSTLQCFTFNIMLPDLAFKIICGSLAFIKGLYFLCPFPAVAFPGLQLFDSTKCHTVQVWSFQWSFKYVTWLASLSAWVHPVAHFETFVFFHGFMLCHECFLPSNLI